MTELIFIILINTVIVLIIFLNMGMLLGTLLLTKIYTKYKLYHTHLIIRFSIGNLRDSNLFSDCNNINWVNFKQICKRKSFKAALTKKVLTNEIMKES